MLLVALEGSGIFWQVWIQQFLRGFSSQRCAAPKSSTLLVAVLLCRPWPHSPICASYALLFWMLAAQTMSFVSQKLRFAVVVFLGSILSALVQTWQP